MNDILKIEHTRTTRERAINRIVELTNELYNIQKQHTSKHKDQTYFGIRDIEHLFDDNNANYYEPMLVRWSFDTLKYLNYSIKRRKALIKNKKNN